MGDLKFACPFCQQHIQAEEGYAGMQINCPACNGSMVVPGTPPAPPPPPPPARQSATRSGACPSCGRALPRGAVLCTHCGYNLVTKQRTVAGRPAALGKPRPSSGETPWYLTPWPYIGAVVLLVGVFYLLGRQYPPAYLGIALVLLLYILVTTLLVLVAAFREGIGTGFLTLCLPFYALYFVFKVNDNDTLKILYGFNILIFLCIKIIGKVMNFE